MRRTLEIINDVQEFDYNHKRIFQHLAKFFDDNEKDALYWDYYELADECEGSTPLLWEQFLDIPEIKHYREVKLSKLWEFKAAKAMRALEEKSIATNSGAVSALKEIMDKSKLFQANYQSNQTIILTHIPKKDYKTEGEEVNGTT